MAKRISKPTTKKETVNNNDLTSKVLPTKHRLKCKNTKQKDFANLITEKEIIIAAGPAGVGKSYVAIARAIELLQNKTNSFKKIVISTPAVESGENLGFLPGDLNEKMEPYIKSSIDIIDKIIGKTSRIKLEEADIIIVEPLGFLRGSTIDNSILVMEEVQNMEPGQVKTLLTRIGENSKFILSGDLDQSDRFKDVTKSGLYDIMKRHRNIEEIGFFEFGVNDIVRNPIITKILKNYSSVGNDINVIKKDKPKQPKPQIIKEGSKPKKKKKTKVLKKLKFFLKKNFNI